MSVIHYQWLNRERHPLQVNYPPKYTWDDYHLNLDKIAEELKGDEARVYIINHYEKGARLPANIVSPHWKRSVRTLNIGYLVYVTEDKVLMTMLRNFLATINYKQARNFDFAANIEAAQAILEEKIATAE